MMGEKLCRILTRLLFAIPLFWGLGDFAKISNAQDYIMAPPIAIAMMSLPPAQMQFVQPQQYADPSWNCGVFGRNNNRGSGCAGGQCGRQQQPAPRQQAPQIGDGVGSNTRRPAGVVLCYSQSGKTQRWFHGTHVVFQGNSYIITCAHGLGAGWDVFCMVNGRPVPIKIIHVAQLDDLAALSVPQGLVAQMPLASTFAAVGETVTLAGRTGIVEGYRNNEILVRGFVKDGDSGGPIYSRNGLLGVIATYEYQGPKMSADGVTSGPNVTRISDFLSGLKAPPSRNAKPPRPLVPVKHPGFDKVQNDLSEALARISKLEDAIKSLPETDCKEVVLQAQRAAAEAEKNKNELERQGKRIAGLETSMKDAQIALLRTTGAVETSQKGVILQKQNVDVLVKRINELELANKQARLRIQRIEQSTTALTSAVDSVQKGKLSFRLRVDQSGRVTGVEAR